MRSSPPFVATRFPDSDQQAYVMWQPGARYARQMRAPRLAFAAAYIAVYDAKPHRAAPASVFSTGFFAWMNHTLALAISIVLLAGCAAAPEPVKPPEEASVEPVEPQPEPEVVETPKPPSTPLLTGPAAKEQAGKLLRQAFESLNDGNEQKARGELEEARRLEPDNRQVACLMRGIAADPVAALGRDSTPYTVRPGELLGRIAQRALGDVCEFYLLARYNQIRVPKALAAGQVIRIPGKVALAPEAPVAKPAPEAAPVEAPPPVSKPAAPDPAVTKAAEEKKRRALIERHHRNAQAAFRRQDLATAIKEWDRVLEIDPGNELARARRQEALDLARRLKQIK
jgi:tetratricopeptide (TPR) repeat protein